jgi:hypothetical protein
VIRHLLGLALTPLLAYPAMFASLAAADMLRGERLVAFHVRHEQRLLWDTFWADFVAALPVAYVVAGGLVVTTLVLRRVAPHRVSAWTLVPLAALTGWGLGVYLTGSMMSTAHASLAVAWAIVGVPLAYCLFRLLPTTAGGASR